MYNVSKRLLGIHRLLLGIGGKYIDNLAYRFPVSVKGVVFQSGKVVLLKNSRGEWELPGGKLELNESPEECVIREIDEELGLRVETGPILDSWVYSIYDGVNVLIVTYGCYPNALSKVIHGLEHRDVGFFALEEVRGLEMPGGYKKSILAWSNYLEAPDKHYPLLK